MDIMKNAAVYYLDGTFRVVNKPFMQLYTIHAFVNSDTNSKKNPMIYVLMSGRRRVDYIAVFRKIKEIIRDEEINHFVLDYERAAWTAIRDVYPNAEIKGCLFNFAQVNIMLF